MIEILNWKTSDRRCAKYFPETTGKNLSLSLFFVDQSSDIYNVDIQLHNNHQDDIILEYKHANLNKTYKRFVKALWHTWIHLVFVNVQNKTDLIEFKAHDQKTFTRLQINNRTSSMHQLMRQDTTMYLVIARAGLKNNFIWLLDVFCISKWRM